MVRQPATAKMVGDKPLLLATLLIAPFLWIMRAL
jgi:hypothetical protein